MRRKPLAVMCLWLFLAPLCVCETAQSQLLPEVKPVQVAPAPRESYAFQVTSGVVTSIEGASITLQGYAVDITGHTRIEESTTGRRRNYIYAGPSLKIAGTFPTLFGVRVASDASGELTVTHADGSTTVVRRREQPHRKYILSDVLRAGYPGIGRHGGLDYTYRTKDLQIGDLIDMQLEVNFYDYPICEAIKIYRRPGGSVPPAPGEVERQKEKPLKRPMWHERANALQDWEEKGIPIPIYFLSSSEQLDRIAPAPRAKK